MDLKKDTQEAYIVERTGLSMCIPFWEVGRDISLRTCSGIISVAERFLTTPSIMFFIDAVCSESN